MSTVTSQQKPDPHDGAIADPFITINPSTIRPKIPRSFLPSLLRVILGLVLITGFMLLIFMLPGLLQQGGISISTEFIDYMVVMLLGTLVGFVEVISRYQDAPFRTATSAPALFYMLVNGAVAATALWMVRLFGWQFIPGDAVAPEVTRWTEVLIAGLGAMAIFRSSLFVIGKEEQEVSIGPSAILEILLNAIDKEVDRFRGRERAYIVKDIMEHVHYNDAILDVTVLSKALLQNLSAEDSAKIDEVRKQIEIITDIDPEVRKYLLGLSIMDVVGEDVLRQAIGIRGMEYYRRALKNREQENRQKAETLSNFSDFGKSLKDRISGGPNPSISNSHNLSGPAPAAARNPQISSIDPKPDSEDP